MMRYLKILFVSMVVIGLMTGSALAASLNAGNTTVASELVPAAGAPVPGGVNTAYQPTGPVAATTQIKVSLTNGTFAAGQIDLCDSWGNSYLAGPVTTVAGATSVTMTLTVPLASGTVYNFQPAACVAGPVALTNVNIAAGAVGGSVVTMTVDNALNPGDPNIYATAPVTTLVDQFSIELTPVTSVIRFAGGMRDFAGTITTSTNTFVLLSNETIGTRVITGLPDNVSCLSPMSGGGGKDFRYTATPGTGNNFSGVATFTFSGAVTGVVIDNVIATGDASATGVVTGLVNTRVCGSATPAATKALAGNRNSLILTVDGTTVITPRTYNIKIDTVEGGEILAAARTLFGPALGWTWRLDATQYYIPLIGSVPPGRETYIKLQSKSTAAGTNGVSVAILASDGTITATYSPGTITSGTPMTITGAQLVAAATAAGKTVDGAAGFAAIITVNAPEADLFVYANMIDAAGAKRIPVKTVAGYIVE